MTAGEVSETDLGKTSFLDLRQGRIMSFPELAYLSGMQLYKSAVVFGGKDTFLFWKISERPEVVPSLTDAATRKQVVKAWKMIEAREPARKATEELAVEARAQKKKSLKQVFADRKHLEVVETPAFSWLSLIPTREGQPRPQINQVKGVDRPGNEFMETVFGLGINKIGVAMNQPQTVAYCIRLRSHGTNPKVQREFFLTAPMQQYAVAYAEDASQAQRTWRKNLHDEAGLHWVRPPAEFTGR